MVEAKIYREVRCLQPNTGLPLIPSQDDLERELERYKEKLVRATRKSSKTSADSSVPNPLPRTSEPQIEERPPTVASSEGGDLCEICDQPGHDIFSCHLLKDDLANMPAPSVGDSEGSDLWCEDCESYGYVLCRFVDGFANTCHVSRHVAAECPHSQEVF